MLQKLAASVHSGYHDGLTCSWVDISTPSEKTAKIGSKNSKASMELLRYLTIYKIRGWKPLKPNFNDKTLLRRSISSTHLTQKQSSFKGR